jgi:hypothetical protein
MEALLIGIDDTDNLESRGTGYRARMLALGLEAEKLGRIAGITRHQLLVHDSIPYTSHNSSACLCLHEPAARDAVIAACRRFLEREAAPGSDVGLCVSTPEQAVRVQAFGRKAQEEVLRLDEAEALAAGAGIHLEGLTGNHGGKIGALAAVGLHRLGEDGRYIWVRGIRDLGDRTLSLEELRRLTGIDVVMTPDGVKVSEPSDLIRLGPWPRPVRQAGRATLLVERRDERNGCWSVVDKPVIKSYRP